MQVIHNLSIVPASGSLSRVSSIAWSPNTLRLAVATADRKVLLFDENGERRDKFPTKNGEKAGVPYSISGLAFSPDSTKLLVAQSDNIVYVYKLGSNWQDKKTICNKFPITSSVTSCVWPINSHEELFFGAEDGKVRSGALRTNKASTIYTGESCVVSMSSSLDGKSLLVGHLDGSVYRIDIDSNGVHESKKLFTHSVAPIALSWGNAILVAGSDSKVVFYDSAGKQLRVFENSDGTPYNDLNCSVVSPSGEVFAVGSYNKILLFSCSGSPSTLSLPYGVQKRGQSSSQFSFAALPNVEMNNWFSVETLCWRSDCAFLVTGNSTGAADIFSTYVKVQRRGNVEMIYPSQSSVVIRPPRSAPVTITSNSKNQILKVKILENRFAVAYTKDSMIITDFTASIPINSVDLPSVEADSKNEPEESRLQSEIPWATSASILKRMNITEGEGAIWRDGQSDKFQVDDSSSRKKIESEKETFFFDFPGIVMIHRNGELIVVRLNQNRVICSVRTENPRLVDIKLSESYRSDSMNKVGVNVFAYLTDNTTIQVLDLSTNTPLIVYKHSSEVTWLSLSGDGTSILCLDSHQNLTLATTICSPHVPGSPAPQPLFLLSRCRKALWVNSPVIPSALNTSTPFSIIIAESSNFLNVWMSPLAAIGGVDPLVIPVSGKLLDCSIAQASAATSKDGLRMTAVVDEGTTTSTVPLPDAIVRVALALASGDLTSLVPLLFSPQFPPVIVKQLWVLVEQLATSAGFESAFDQSRDALSSVPTQQFDLSNLSSSSNTRNPSDNGSISNNSESVNLLLGSIASTQAGNVCLSRFLRRASKASGDAAARATRLALRTGYITCAETALMRHNRPREVVALYEFLHRPSAAVAVAESHGLPGAVEKRQQLLQHLLSTGQESLAALEEERNGNLVRAVELYVRGRALGRAASLVVSRVAQLPPALVASVRDALASAGMQEQLAEVLQASGDSEGAIDSFLDAGAYPRALHLARRASPARAPAIERAWADSLRRSGMLLQSIDKYESCGAFSEAVDAALASGLFERACQLAQRVSPLRARQVVLEVARKLTAAGNSLDAEPFFVRAEQFAEAVDAHVQQGRPAAVERLFAQLDTQKRRDLAPMLLRAARGKHTPVHHAEKYFLLADAPEEAARALLAANEFEGAVRLAKQHCPALLPKILPEVNASLVAKGDLGRLEHLLVSIGDWRAAVALHESAGDADAAARVARTYGSSEDADLVLLQIAENLGFNDEFVTVGSTAGGELGEKEGAAVLASPGASLLQKHALVEFAVRHYCLRGNWQLARALAHALAPALVDLVDVEEGQQLLRTGHIQLAEPLFLRSGRVLDLLSSLVEARDFESAQRIVNLYAQSYSGDVLVAEAESILWDLPLNYTKPSRQSTSKKDTFSTNEKGDDYPEIDRSVVGAALERCEPLFVRGRQPLRAVEAWLERGFLAEALRACRSHAPVHVDTVLHAVRECMEGRPLPRLVGGSASSSAFGSLFQLSAVAQADPQQRWINSFRQYNSMGMIGVSIGRMEPLAAAELWESAGEPMRAVEALLSATLDTGQPTDVPRNSIVAVWTRAFELALSHDASRAVAIGDRVGGRLLMCGFPAEAGEIFARCDLLEKAVDAFVRARAWENARGCAVAARNAGLGDALISLVDAAQRRYIVATGSPEEMVEVGALSEAARTYAKAGRLDMIFSLASKGLESAVLAEFLYPHLGASVAAGRLDESLALLTKVGAPPAQLMPGPGLAALSSLTRAVISICFVSVNEIPLSSIKTHGNNANPPKDADSNLAERKKRAEKAMAKLNGLRNVLYSLVSILKAALNNKHKIADREVEQVQINGSTERVLLELEQLLLAVHFCKLLFQSGLFYSTATNQVASSNFAKLAFEQSIAILRASNIVPVDSAYFFAGYWAMMCGRDGLSKLFWNRFIDVSDAIAENRKADGSADAKEYSDAGFPPLESISMPLHATVKPVDSKFAKDFILSSSINSTSPNNEKQTLPRKPCMACGEMLFEGALGCIHCGGSFPLCVVSGFPIPHSQNVECKACGSKAVRGAWNLVVEQTKECPWCNSHADLFSN